ncbi:DegT/DnrJ/EryC1/StrS family aminotransferase [Providencia rettgeri]|uniref:DegT/DnrJ/EryC1/StrS family aminotransferase n=1 Tax=Providencia rettgeri TaxID=587 RepID=UPI002551E843|nr:DegT/DnrJ/EryC1/StrS family aminotransferase [Providencia rettgeri]MDK7745670.1 DegT/DnrJ/EryC1/StrS family aminotransferase [Providencia rettgeri]MDK7758020.1 DegT/DnrJ/EryC1/StrS family aminotransferase [Providencia rettgeri]
MTNFFLSPVYRISPFRTSDYSKRVKLLNQPNKNENITNERIKNSYQEYYTNSGRDAIELYLKHLKLNIEDEVTIFTTTSSFYVSSCVTNTIEKVCRWNRKVTNKTKCIIVIHEFGKLYTNIDKLSIYNVPILEDFAHSFSSLYYTDNIKGDAAIFSLSKFLSIDSGGILLSKDEVNIHSNQSYHSFFYKNKNNIPSQIKKRKIVESYYIKKLKDVGISPYFIYSKNEAPGAFVFNINRPIEYLQELKHYLQGNFIECSVFYENQAFFLPCHHELELEDIDYICDLMKEYLRKHDNK